MVDAEIWAPIPGYGDRYEVSSLGRVLSRPRRGVRGGLLSPKPSQDGYLRVSLRKDGKLRVVQLHRLVAMAFHGDKRNALHNEVAHLDGNRANPRADNLKWVSKVENRSHRKLHGTECCGEAHGAAKLTDAKVREILASTNFATVIAARFGISRHTVAGIRRGASWKHLREGNRTTLPTIHRDTQ